MLPRSYAVVTDMGRGVTGNGGDGSFGRLARFIGVFGTPENGKAKPIAMTAPVVTEAPSLAPTGAITFSAGNLTCVLAEQSRNVTEEAVAGCDLSPLVGGAPVPFELEVSGGAMLYTIGFGE